jgi:N,N'-diacetyllegionaminate synthase
MANRIQIGNRWIGESEQPFVIAEIGSNHNQKIDQAKELIDAAADAGADAVKFQFFKAENFYPPSDPIFKIMKDAEFPREWAQELSEYSKKKNVFFMASPFDNEAVDLLVKVKSPALKIASSDTVNLPLLRHAALTGLPMLISTGMCNLADVYEAVEVVRNAGNDKIVLLQCAALYPANAADLNLKAMNAVGEALQTLVGFSDHTLQFYTPSFAVARGACVIEKHVTLSRKLPGPDHSYALEPAEFAQMVQAIREAHAALGSSVKRMLPEERKVARRTSILAKKEIRSGEEIREDMVVIQRPAVGIDGRFLPVVVGQKATRTFKADEPITWDALN